MLPIILPKSCDVPRNFISICIFVSSLERFGYRGAISLGTRLYMSIWSGDQTIYENMVWSPDYSAVSKVAESAADTLSCIRSSLSAESFILGMDVQVSILYVQVSILYCAG